MLALGEEGGIVEPAFLSFYSGKRGLGHIEMAKSECFCKTLNCDASKGYIEQRPLHKVCILGCIAGLEISAHPSISWTTVHTFKYTHAWKYSVATGFSAPLVAGSGFA